MPYMFWIISESSRPIFHCRSHLAAYSERCISSWKQLCEGILYDIKKFIIANLKNISDRYFDLDFITNRPSLLVAQNGFAISLFAPGLLNLQTNRISVHEDHHQSGSESQSKLSLEYSDGEDVEHLLIVSLDNNGSSSLGMEFGPGVGLR